jgi:hypothetical protein
VSFLKRYILIRSLALPALGLASGAAFLLVVSIPVVSASLARILIQFLSFLLEITPR